MSKVPAAVAEQIRQTLPDFLTAVGGERTEKRKLSVKWSSALTETTDGEPPFSGFDIEAEIASALCQEIAAELSLKLVHEAREVAPVVDTLDLSVMDTNGPKIDDALRDISEDATIIVSPSALTLLHCLQGEDWKFEAFSREASEANRINPVPVRPVGILNGRTLFVDPYATDNVPILICEPGWFTYKAGVFVYEGLPVVNDKGHKAQNFYDDVDYEIDATKLKALAVQVK